MMLRLSKTKEKVDLQQNHTNQAKVTSDQNLSATHRLCNNKLYKYHHIHNATISMQPYLRIMSHSSPF